ncbi:leucine rich repeat [Trypanosoma equiperdum]|uniref:Leucine-rich repeat protein (LRRP) n=2 Tax=Trypanozoon TaxID=39700 RepID=Q384D3_TRYB2|nr:hypothetical protein, conserved [Trypanosoma brucei brucei TREU927]EAN79848.1 hypothetical protein, conserved [Trypanosoma brucei brucei TREU927]SCU71458.1 leucine rich repeat [Trypanosoma equiperdum]
MHSKASSVYIEACKRDHAECALEFVYALDNNESEVCLSNRTVHLNDIDVKCIAETLQTTRHTVRALIMEGNAFGLNGLQALLEAIEVNPGIVRELRLGRNKLKDQAAVVIGHVLSRSGCGLRVLDLSENEITKLGVIPIAAALSNGLCDIVELSFHNNKIEADAATYLGQAIRQAGKLKHLHLGYNTIRDEGAVQLAKCIPVTVSLSTLDLTANRIGASGGRELARALMTTTCNIQRLNLRHNLFDSETIEMYGEVIARNTSLIQLFLGFMNPAPESAAVVLSSLRKNRTMLLLDIYGWKLPPDEAWTIINSIQKSNTILMALVTDACQSIAKQIDQGNEERDYQGQYPIYVGPDDRDAYMATKSLRRASRAQSRRQSRSNSRIASSRNATPSALTTPVNRRQHERTSSRKNSENQSRQSASNSQIGREPNSQRDQSYVVPPHTTSTDRSQEKHRDIQRRSSRGLDPSASYDARVNQGTNDASPMSVFELAQSNKALESLVDELRREIARQKENYRALEARVTALEMQGRCPTVPQHRTSGVPSREETVDLRRLGRPPSTTNDDASHPAKSIMSTPCNSERAYDLPSPGDLRRTNTQSDFAPPNRSASAVELYSLRRRRSNALITTGHDLNQSRTSEVESRGAPAEYPQLNSLRGDPSFPPAEPVQLPMENKPLEVVLQTSAKPREETTVYLGPGPCKDKDPPRRKGSVQSIY